MGYGLTTELQMIALGLFAICAYIASRELPMRWAVGIALVRVVLVIGYFASSYGGIWNLQDDLIYTMQGHALIDEGYSPLSLLSSQGIETLQSLAGGRHILYIWWTFTWLWLLGEHYYAPVVANVMITFLSGHMLALLLREVGFARLYRNVITAFYLLHWDTIAWSSFLSLKDCLVQCLTIAAFLFGTRFIRHRSLLWGIMLALTLLLFQYIRFYIPVLMAAGLGIWLIFESRDPIKILFFLAVGSVLVMLAPWHHFEDTFNPMVLLYGSIRFLLTPQPWAILPSYSFLYIPSLAHWILFLPALIGGIYLFTEHRFFRLLVWYLLVLLVFYAAVDQLQGVRHRAQITFLFAWAQMHFFLQWTRARVLETRRLPRPVTILPHPAFQTAYTASHLPWNKS